MIKTGIRKIPEVAFDRGFMPVKDKAGNEYNKLVFAADYASGKNALGGGGAGLYYYFTKDISLLTGPVWFNEKVINGNITAWRIKEVAEVNVPKGNGIRPKCICCVTHRCFNSKFNKIFQFLIYFFQIQ